MTNYEHLFIKALLYLAQSWEEEQKALAPFPPFIRDYFSDSPFDAFTKNVTDFKKEITTSERKKVVSYHHYCNHIISFLNEAYNLRNESCFISNKGNEDLFSYMRSHFNLTNSLWFVETKQRLALSIQLSLFIFSLGKVKGWDDEMYPPYLAQINDFEAISLYLENHANPVLYALIARIGNYLIAYENFYKLGVKEINFLVEDLHEINPHYKDNHMLLVKQCAFDFPAFTD